MGRPREDVLGRAVAELYPETVGSVFEEAFRTRDPLRGAGQLRGRRARPDGRRAGSRCAPGRSPAASPSTSSTSPTACGPRRPPRRATGRTALLASVTAELSGALDGESALGRLAQLVVPTLADACIVTVVDREGRARDVGSWHADPERRALLERYTEIRLDTLPMASPVARALHAGHAR